MNYHMDLNHLKKQIDKINNTDFDVIIKENPENVKASDIHNLIACIVPEMLQELMAYKEKENCPIYNLRYYQEKLEKEVNESKLK